MNLKPDVGQKCLGVRSMNKKKVKQVILNTLITTLIVVGLWALAGCSTLNGLARDVKSVSEFAIDSTQKGADKQMGDSIAWAIRDQTRLMRNGQQVAAGLGR